MKDEDKKKATKLKVDEVENGEVERYKKAFKKLLNKEGFNNSDDAETEAEPITKNIESRIVVEKVIKTERKTNIESQISQLDEKILTTHKKVDKHELINMRELESHLQEGEISTNTKDKNLLRSEIIELKEKHKLNGNICDNNNVKNKRNQRSNYEKNLLVSDDNNNKSIEKIISTKKQYFQNTDSNMLLERQDTKIKAKNTEYDTTAQESTSSVDLNVDKMDFHSRRMLRKYCCKTIMESNLSIKNLNRGGTLKFLCFVCELCLYFKSKPCDVNLEQISISDKEISPLIFELGTYLLEYGKTTHGIFRYSARPIFSQQYPFLIHEGRFYDYKNNTIKDNAVVFKSYIREILNGLFPLAVTEKIYKMYKEARSIIDTNVNFGGQVFKENVKELIQRYMCFTLDPKSHKLLKLIFKLFRAITKNIKTTEIDTSTLLNLFSVNVFPKDIIKDYEDCKILPEILELLYYSDIENINIEVYRGFLLFMEGNN